MLGMKKSVVKMKMRPLTFGEFLAIDLLFFILSFIVPVIFFHARIISTVVGFVATVLFFVVCWAVVIVALGKKGLIKKGAGGYANDVE